jgi:hypothetical protein
MNRNKRNIFMGLLGSIHACNESPELSPTWRDGVMNEIARNGRHAVPQSDWEYYAPRFALAGTAMSVLFAMTAGWSLSALTGNMNALFTDQLFSVVPMSLMSM